MPSSRRAAADGASQDWAAGPLVWIHAADAEQIAALIQLGLRAQAMRPDLRVLLTAAEAGDLPEKLPAGMRSEVLGDDQTGQVRAFLSRWQPRLCVWQFGHLRPTLLNAARSVGLPMLLIDADELGFQEHRLPWRRRSDRLMLGHFSAIFANSANVARTLVRNGADPDRVEVTGPLQEGGAALPCNEDDRADLSETLAIRPVWLAPMVQPDEVPTVIEAHRQALRVAHRLMLILVPNRPEDGAAMIASLRDQGLRHVVWSEGGLPEETTQVLVADTYGELGLWYRLAPLTFMGSSLTAGHGGRDPYEPAALGSAILYGPNVGRHLRAYSRFAKAGAARMVRDASSLSNAVLRMNAPDQAAAMAQAAWEVATEGAEVTDKVLEQIEDLLDRTGAGGPHADA